MQNNKIRDQQERSEIGANLHSLISKWGCAHELDPEEAVYYMLILVGILFAEHAADSALPETVDRFFSDVDILIKSGISSRRKVDLQSGNA